MTATDLNHSKRSISKSADDKTRQLLSRALILLGFVSLTFAAIPELDLIVSRFFWDPVSGFKLNDNSALIAIRDTSRLLTWVVIGSAMVLLIQNLFMGYSKYSPAPHKLLFVLSFFAAGPGLSVELIKTLVGRARPRDLEEFGGNAFFTPPWEITSQCVSNCSFISSESSSAFALLTLVVFVKPKYSLFYLGAVGIISATFSLNRVLLGAHFISDVLISWNVMMVLAILFWRLFSRNSQEISAIFVCGSRLTNIR